MGAVARLLSAGALGQDDLTNGLVASGMSWDDATELIDELFRAHVLVSEDSVREPLDAPPADFPLQSLVMNLTNQCNLACTYCYEFGGEDKVATPEGQA